MKRIFDLVIALILLVLFLPVLIIVAMLVRFSMGSPILFRQLRPGLDEVPFPLLKFRTMADAYHADGRLLSDDNRLTGLGIFLRNWSLDELPQLINVLRGDMSLVGPRPLMPHYLNLYNARQRTRCQVRPGITGWAQVNGRNQLDWPERLEMDVWYVENQSFWLDMKILFLTAIKVLRREGISDTGSPTMTPFMGNEKNADRSD